MIAERLVLATGNPGKVEELRALIGLRTSAEILSLAEFPSLALPEETGASYAENALLKARAVAAATGLPALADDSGLEVDGLGGQPGVHSARYAPTEADRIARLLAALRGRHGASRRARFRCVVALAWPDGGEALGEGSCEGSIVDRPRGDCGFGYDPVFLSDDLGVTFAEAAPADKQRVSHRARAMDALFDSLSRA